MTISIKSLSFYPDAQTWPRTDPSTVEEQLWNLGSQRRLQIEVFTLFSFFAVVLLAFGIYAVMAYAVGQRTREIGIRMALGARRVDVLLMMLHQALLPVGLGLLAGVAAALAISRTFAGMLYGVPSTDPGTYAAVCLFLLAIAAVAAYNSGSPRDPSRSAICIALRIERLRPRCRTAGGADSFSIGANRPMLIGGALSLSSAIRTDHKPSLANHGRGDARRARKKRSSGAGQAMIPTGRALHRFSSDRHNNERLRENRYLRGY